MNLKPCPFCGSSATVYTQQHSNFCIQESYIIECDNDECGCTYGENMLLSLQEVIMLWNKRSDKKMTSERALENEPKKGKWLLHGMIYYCSNCGHDCEQGGNNYCGNCGADMRGGYDNDNR